MLPAARPRPLRPGQQLPPGDRARKGRSLSPSLPDSVLIKLPLIFSSLLLSLHSLDTGARSFLRSPGPALPWCFIRLHSPPSPNQYTSLRKKQKHNTNNVLPGNNLPAASHFHDSSWQGWGPCPRAVDSRARGLAPSDPRPPQPEGRGARDPRSEAGQKCAVSPGHPAGTASAPSSPDAP